MEINRIFTWFNRRRIGGIFFISLSILLSFLYLDNIIKVVVIGVIKFVFAFATSYFTLKFMFNDYYKCLFEEDCDINLLTPAYRKSSLTTFYVILITSAIIISML
tara:strand:+ start:4526 stop:4840 length:315 start_codon:yes stop_codon:yes gene_type:complete